MDRVDVEFRAVTKRYGALDVLRGVSLTIRAGEFVSLLGPSGCGKSTLLRILAGLDDCDSGDVLIGGASVRHQSPGQRNIAMIFQSFALYPHMSVRQNLAAPLVMSRQSFLQRQPLVGRALPGTGRLRAEIAGEVARVAELLQITALLDRKPGQLSGGQKQRVAIGRAIIRRPRLFLMDEPLSSLDAGLRATMRSELVELQRQLGITTIYVTHDQTEAMTMSDRIALMMGGQIVQTGSPSEIFHDPAHLSVASFVGTPRINLLPATVEDGRVHCLGIALPIAVPSATSTDAACQLGFRPEDLRLATELDTASDLAWPADIVRSEEIGHERLVHLRARGSAPGNLIVRQSAESRSESDLPPIGPVAIVPDLRRAKLFDGAGNRIAPLISTVEPTVRASRAGGRF